MNKRKYFRICPVCKNRYEQGDMVRTSESCTGWICFDCFERFHQEQFCEDF